MTAKGHKQTKQEYWKPEGFETIRGAAAALDMPVGVVIRAVRDNVVPVYTLPHNKRAHWVKVEEVREAFIPKRDMTRAE